MRPDLAIAQALLNTRPTGPSVVARSGNFLPEWDVVTTHMCERFGHRSPGVHCQDALFAYPLLGSHVAVVQVTEQGDTELSFRVLVLHRKVYDALGDPFVIADRYPPNWAARGDLASLEWPEELLPKRQVADLQTILKSGDMPLLLGGAQALIDGSRLLLQSHEPMGKPIRDLWKLLPNRTRCELWPATFAFSDELGFHVLAMPEPPTQWPMGYLTADQARDYPEGRYELALQLAVEDSDQREVDRLLARRSSSDTLRLALFMVIIAFVASAISKFLI